MGNGLGLCWTKFKGKTRWKTVEQVRRVRMDPTPPKGRGGKKRRGKRCALLVWSGSIPRSKRSKSMEGTLNRPTKVTMGMHL